jgi:hypothetical protein
MPTTSTAASIASQYETMTGDREITLARAREAAAYTLPWVCPDDDHITRNNDDPIKYAANQSVGGRLTQGLIAQIVQIILPYQASLFTYDIAPKYANNASRLSRQQRDTFDLMLRTREQAVCGLIHSQSATANRGRRSGTVLAASNALVAQKLITGNACWRIDDEGAMTVFPLANWVVHRDSMGDILCLIVKERIDPLELTQDQQQALAAGKPGDWETITTAKHAYDRLRDVYHRMTWDTEAKRWRIESECIGVIVATMTDPNPPYWCSADNLMPGEHYGNSLVSIALPDLRTIDELTIAMRDHAALASFCVLALDYLSPARESQIKSLAPRETVRLDVKGGQVNDVALFSPTNVPSFQVSKDSLDRTIQAMSQFFLEPGGMVRDAERTTALEVARVTLQQLQNSLGVLMLSLTEQFSPHLIRRFERVAEGYNVIPTFTQEMRDTFMLRIKTGAAALADQQGATQLATYIDLETKFAQQQIPGHIDRRRVSMSLAKMMHIDTSIFRTPDEERQAEQEKRQQEVAQQSQIDANRITAEGARDLVLRQAGIAAA